jgi:hypothetical protein
MQKLDYMQKNCKDSKNQDTKTEREETHHIHHAMCKQYRGVTHDGELSIRVPGCLTNSWAYLSILQHHVIDQRPL